MAASKRLAEMLAGAVPITEGGPEKLVAWAQAVEESDTKLHPECDLARDTTGATIPIEDRVGEHADVDVGGFEEGWICVPAMSAECHTCESEQPALVLSHAEQEIILLDCIGCQTRYDLEALDGGGD
jgi:hypothetical protein